MVTQDIENTKKNGDGYETLRVRAGVKARVQQIQNDYFNAPATKGRKITVSNLITEALDARGGKAIASSPKAPSGPDPDADAIRGLLRGDHDPADENGVVANVLREYLKRKRAQQPKRKLGLR